MVSEKRRTFANKFAKLLMQHCTNKMLNSKFDSMQSIESSNKGEIVMYQPDETIRLEVRVEDETVWLNRRKSLLTYQLSQILRQFKLKVAALLTEL